MENKIKHLELIQGIINRMSGNLFYLKGWAITLIAALFALAAKDSDKRYILVAYFPVLVFWILDGYFLSQERLFRDLYEDVRKRNSKNIDYSMDASKYMKNPRNSWISSMFSKTLLVFYLSLVSVMLFTTYLTR
ncbi:MAG: hypothetical protein KCHDKBKB_03124 [Elusimicrobia bacterium]|nr:hypothetical protein [Elusimicrobiota bacterium]